MFDTGVEELVAELRDFLLSKATCGGEIIVSPEAQSIFPYILQLI